MIQFDPNNRPNAVNILKHPFFEEITIMSPAKEKIILSSKKFEKTDEDYFFPKIENKEELKDENEKKKNVTNLFYFIFIFYFK